MSRTNLLAAAILLLLSMPGSSASLAAREAEEPVLERRGAAKQIARDYRELATRGRLSRLAAALGTGGVLANTDGDQTLYDEYRELLEPEDGQDLSRTAKALGDEIIAPVVVISALAVGLGESDRDGKTGRWWRRTARAYLVGAPPLYYLQQLTGGNRPGEPEGSGWKPFEGNHGISGHAFFGAVPLLTAARISERRWVRALGIAASLLPAWSRVHDGEHYPSQALLGWYLAWEATGAVAGSGTDRAIEVQPLYAPQGVGLAVRWRPRSP